MPPPARSAEAFGGPALSGTDYLSSLKLGRKTKKMAANGSRMEQNVFIRISHLIELMVVVRFGLDTRSGLCDNWSVGL